MTYYLGIDVGATNLQAAVADRDLTTVAQARTDTPNDGTEAEVVGALCRTIERALADAGLGSNQLTAAGAGSFGPFDRGSGTVIEPANVAADRIPIVPTLRDLLDTDRICLRNDSICGVLAERRFVTPSADNLVYLTFSTGIGAGVIVDGCVLSGNVAEVGHLTVDPAGAMPCQCGAPGHWEAYCGGKNLPDYARSLGNGFDGETALPIGNPGFSAKDVFARAGADDLADRVLERFHRWNAIGVANVIHAFAPDHIAIGGAIAINNPDRVVAPLRARVPERVLLEMPSIAVTSLGDDVVLKGALVLAQAAGDDPGSACTGAR